MDVENVNDRPTVSSSAAMDWAAAFQSPEFCSGFQTVVAGAIAKAIGARGSTESSVTTLEQMGEVCPTAMFVNGSLKRIENIPWIFWSCNFFPLPPQSLLVRFCF